MAEETSLVAQQIRLSQWAAQIRDCQNRPEGMDDNNNDFLAELLPWSETLPEHIRKPVKSDDK